MGFEAPDHNLMHFEQTLRQKKRWFQSFWNRKRISSVTDIENIIGQGSLYTSLPKASLKNKKSIDSAHTYINENPLSLLTEHIRSLLVSLRLRDRSQHHDPHVISVTSTYKGEGKTTTAIWLATIAAQSGKKVLIIDADMRAPSLHKAYNIGNAKGVADYLSHRLPLDDTLYKKHPSNVHLMTNKAIPTYALTLLGSIRMKNLIRRVRDMYDLVLIDCPASNIYSDARLVSTLCDKTLYIVKKDTVQNKIFLETLRSFVDIGVSDKDMAFVMTQHEKDTIIKP